MGAIDFVDSAEGVSAEEAFSTAVAEARHWHGHGGYTGTIAEKDGFVLYELPRFVKAEAVAHAILTDEQDDDPENRKLVGLVGDVKVADDIANRYFDKWGPAVCVRESDTRFGFCGLASC